MVGQAPDLLDMVALSQDDTMKKCAILRSSGINGSWCSGH